MRKSFLVFGEPSIEQPEMDEMQEVLTCAWLGTGPRVAKFENEFMEYKGASYAAAVNSCTAGLHLSCYAAGLQPGDEVITTTITFCATVNAIIHSGATPVLADIDPVTWNIDVEDVRRKISSRTKAIIPVHFAGRPCNMDGIMAIAREFGLIVIEDCAHAIETEYKGSKAGMIGDFGVFSFYATKNVATGEGGMVISCDEKKIERIKMLALHGLSRDAWKRFSDSGYKHYYVHEAGFKYNMMDLQAVLGIHQLRRVEKNAIRRLEIWNKYMQAFSDLPVGLPAPFEPCTRHALHLFTIIVNPKQAGIDRDTFLEQMTANKIGVGVHYLSIPEHPYYQKRFGWSPEDYPVAKQFGRKTASLPLSAKLTDEDVNDVIHAVTKIVTPLKKVFHVENSYADLTTV